jgi:hypothetical protein
LSHAVAPGVPAPPDGPRILTQGPAAGALPAGFSKAQMMPLQCASQAGAAVHPPVRPASKAGVAPWLFSKPSSCKTAGSRGPPRDES